MANNKKVIKVQCPFERIKKYNAHSEAALYKAVIMQMIIDASNISKDPKACRNERKAKEWLFSSSDDFKLVCLMAGIESEIIVRLAKVLIKIHHSKEASIIQKRNNVTAGEVKEYNVSTRKLSSIRSKAQNYYLMPFFQLN